MKPFDLTNPDRLTCDEMPPEMLATMKACAEAGARVEFYYNIPQRWREIDPAWVGSSAYRLWPLIGERREWRGGPCPMPVGTEVTAWLRNDDIKVYQPAKFRWEHSKLHPALDIIAYRVDFLPEAVPSENCVSCGRVIDTREKESGGDGLGAENDDGSWSCTSRCQDQHHRAVMIAELRAMRMRPEVRKMVDRFIAVVECGE